MIGTRHRVMSFVGLTLNLKNFEGTREECIAHVIGTRDGLLRRRIDLKLTQRVDGVPVSEAINWELDSGDIMVIPDDLATRALPWLIGRRGEMGGYDLIDEKGRVSHVVEKQDAGTPVVSIQGVPSTLTEREMQVVRAMVDGMTAKQTATELGISIKTAEAHRIRAFKKLGANNAPHAVAIALRTGLVK